MKLWAEGKSKAYIYTRYGNPTLTVAQEKIAALEGAEAAVVTASGMAAISCALLGALKAGDELISTAQLYGGSYRLMRDIFPDMGITVHHVETDLAGMEEKLSPKTKVLYVETPTNPMLRLVDLHKAMAFAKKHKLISIIDNTFATPILQNPIAMGYDMVVHSATKALAGHSDIIAGAVAGSTEWMEHIQHMVISLGGSMDPEAAFLLIRGMKTLGLRVQRQCENAMAVAKFLEKHPAVAARALSGIEIACRSRHGQEADARVWLHAGFDLKGGLEAARRVWRSRATVSAGRQPGRHGIAGGVAAVHLALQHERCRIAARRSKPGNGAGFHWRGRCRGFDCGFAAGIGIAEDAKSSWK